jgi:hypothetical protein
VRLRRLGSLRMAAGLDHHHGLDASGGARRRHEFARVVDRLDVKQNRPGRAVEREEIEQVAEIDVDLVSERDGRREADVVRCRPLDKARRYGAGLRDEGELTGGRHAGGETGVELDARRQHAKTIRADESQAADARRLLAGIGERAFCVPKPGGDDDRGCRPFFTGRRDDAGDRLRRRRDHEQIGRLWQLLDGFDGFDPLDLAVVRVDETDRPFEARGAKVSQHRTTGRRVTRACPHNRDRSRRKQLVETIGRHRPTHSTR